MVDFARVQDRIYNGYAKTAAKIGAPFSFYRPTVAAADPLASALFVQNASINNRDFKYQTTNKFGDAYNYAITDGRNSRVGDYLSDGKSTYFIASQNLDLPISAIQCNRRVALLAAPAVRPAGAVPYGGECANEDIVVVGDPVKGAAAGWPCSLLLGGMGFKQHTLPGSTRADGYRVLLPPSLPYTPQSGQVMLDDLGYRYSISGIELTDLGWRLAVTQEHL